MKHTIPEIPVLYFHSIAPEKNKNWSRNYLTLELFYFEEFLKYLKKNRWETIFLEEYYYIRTTGSNSPKHICCLTFDDGFLDNYVYVYPLLKRYGFKGTIFVNPDFVDLRRSTSQTLEDVWSNRVMIKDLMQWGYLSWDEMRIMQKSGVIDIQSHTLTHTKHYISDELVTFHYPEVDCLYSVGNLFPNRKPYYINDKEFEKLIPYGTPYFKTASAVMAKKVYINNSFIETIIEMLMGFKWDQTQAIKKAFEITNDEYQNKKKQNKIIEGYESTESFQKRISKEIVESKIILERELKKEIKFLCWPHGDNNEKSHQIAIDNGYKATTTGSKQKFIASTDRISIRTSIGVIKNNIFLSNLKTKYRMLVLSDNQPMKFYQKIYQKLK